MSGYEGYFPNSQCHLVVTALVCSCEQAPGLAKMHLTAYPVTHIGPSAPTFLFVPRLRQSLTYLAQVCQSRLALLSSCGNDLSTGQCYLHPTFKIRTSHCPFPSF